MKNHFKSAIMAVAAIAVTGFTSCNKNDGPDPGEERGAILNITLTNPTLDGTRASGTLPTDNTIANFTVFVFNADGSFAASQHFTGNSDGDEQIRVTTNAREVYVIANAGDQRNNYSTKAALGTTAINLLTTQYTLENSGRWATGNETLSAFSSDPTPVATATVALTFVAARIALTVVDEMTNTDAEGAATINSVAVLNARGQSRIFPGTGSSLIPQSTDAGYTAASQYLEGLDISTFDNKPESSLYSGTTAEMLTAYNASLPDGQKYYFYVFENHAITKTTAPTIVTLVATAGGTTFYLPVHLAPYETFTDATTALANGVVRGNSYDITITLTGDATTIINRGTDDPTEPLLSGLVNVTLELSNWTAVPLGKVF